MKDILIDDKLRLVHNGDFQIVNSNRADRQRLFLFLNYLKKGDFFWNDNYGFDRTSFIALCKLRNEEKITNYLITAVKDVEVTVTMIEIGILSDQITIQISLADDIPIVISVDT